LYCIFVVVFVKKCKFHILLSMD